MSTFTKFSARFLAVVAVCAALSACSQSIGESGSFPTYSPASVTSAAPSSSGLMELQ